MGETGLIGTVPFLLLWLVAIVTAFRIVISNLHKNYDRAVLALFALMILGGYALQQNGEWTIMRVSPDHYLFFFTVAMVFSLNEYIKKDGVQRDAEFNEKPISRGDSI